jgi:Ca2+-binding RTX toxin-like protein
MATPTEWLAKFNVNTGAADSAAAQAPQIIGLGNGNFLVAWEEFGTAGVGTQAGFDIIGKIFDAEGNVVRESYLLNTATNTDNERDFSIAATNDGGFMLAYVDEGASAANDTRIVWQRHNDLGDQTSGRILVSNDPVSTVSNPQLVVNTVDNSSFVTWQDTPDTGDSDIFGIRISGSNVVGTQFDVAANGANQTDNATALNTTGNPVTIYAFESTDLEINEYNASGIAIRSGIVIGSEGAQDAQVASLLNGTSVVVWETDGNDIVFVIATPSGTGFSISGTTAVVSGTNDQNQPQIVAMPDGGFTIIWDDDTAGEIAGQRYNADGSANGSQFVIESTGNPLGEIGVTADGRLLMSWQLGGDIFKSIYDPRDGATIEAAEYNNLPGNFLDFSNVITAGIAGSTVNGTAEDETLLGQAGDDTLNGGAGADIISGGAGDDTISGGSGNDTLDGGDGIDLLDYSSLTQDFDVNLATGVTMSGGTVVAETAVNFENIDTGSGDNEIIGNDENNLINAGAGNDIINGGAGNDIINGGAGDDIITDGGAGGLDFEGTDELFGDAGNDTLVINSASGGETINGGTGIDTLDISGDSFDFSDVSAINLGAASWTSFDATFSGFENVTAGSGQHDITGSSGANIILAGDGTDTVSGGFGADTLDGEAGIDILTFEGENREITVDLSGPSASAKSAVIDLTSAATSAGVLAAAEAGNIYFNVHTTGTPSGLIRGQVGVIESDTTDMAGVRTLVFAVVDMSPDNEVPPVMGSDASGAASLTFVDDGMGGITYSARIVAGGFDAADIIGAHLHEAAEGANGSVVENIIGDGATVADEQEVDMIAGFENVTGGTRNDFITGDGAVNILIGNSGNDILRGGDGADTLNGGDDNDTLRGGADADILNGGGGIDLADYADAGMGLVVDLQNTANNAGDALGDSYTEIENVRGSVSNDSLRGDAGDNVVFGLSGDDFIVGRDGNDTLFGNSGDDTLRGGDGADALDGGGGVDVADYSDIATGLVLDLQFIANNTGQAAGDSYTNVENLTATNADDNLRGDAGNNIITARGGDDFMSGRDGDDILIGSAGDDTLRGGNGADRLVGGAGIDIADYRDIAAGLLADLQFAGNNTGGALGDTYVTIENLFGTASDDSLRGNGFDNLIIAGAGDDFVAGRSGVDTLIGNAGNDILRGGTGGDVLNGGNGQDRADYSDATFNVRADLVNSAVNVGAHALGDTYISIEDIRGTNGFNDDLRGDGGDNILEGLAGNDKLTGRAGNDTLAGGAGNDTLTGGAGNDLLIGGGGDDVFIFTAPTQGVDTMLGFTINSDVIHLDDAGFTALSAGALSAANFHVGAAAADANDFLVYDGTTLFYDADGNGAGAQIALTTFNNSAALDENDFLIV